VGALCAVFFWSLPFCGFAAAQSPIDTGDTAWILVSTALVLFMTVPALALFYGGLVRTKNVLSVLMQCLALTAVLSLVWLAVGYSLAFDSTAMVQGEVNLRSFIGSLSKTFLRGVDASSVTGTIPEVLFFAFQMPFAIITPALIVGAFAERMKFSATLWFSVLWLLVVYAPICHMTWGGDGGYFADLGVLDFAGGIVVHITAGVAALVACILVGRRRGYPEIPMPPHNLTMTVTGTAMLWVGWFGFNAGSALGANGGAAMALTVTHIAAATATVTWMAIEWIKNSKPSVLGAATGAIAGLAIGFSAGVICWFASVVLKGRLGYDDSLDVFGVHGVGGLVGTILAGVFAAKAFGGNQDISVVKQVGIQAYASVVTIVYTLIVSFILLKLIDAVIGLRVEDGDEIEGLDLRLHEEVGYNLDDR